MRRHDPLHCNTPESGGGFQAAITAIDRSCFSRRLPATVSAPRRVECQVRCQADCSAVCRRSSASPQHPCNCNIPPSAVCRQRWCQPVLTAIYRFSAPPRPPAIVRPLQSGACQRRCLAGISTINQSVRLPPTPLAVGSILERSHLSALLTMDGAKKMGIPSARMFFSLASPFGTVMPALHRPLFSRCCPWTVVRGAGVLTAVRTLRQLFSYARCRRIVVAALVVPAGLRLGGEETSGGANPLRLFTTYHHQRRICEGYSEAVRTCKKGFISSLLTCIWGRQPFSKVSVCTLTKDSTVRQHRPPTHPRLQMRLQRVLAVFRRMATRGHTPYTPLLMSILPFSARLAVSKRL